MMRRVWSILFYTPLSLRPPLLPLQRRAIQRGEEIISQPPSDEDYLILGAGRARSLTEARQLREEYGDALAVLRHNKRRQRQRMPGYMRLYRRLQRWIV